MRQVLNHCIPAFYAQRLTVIWPVITIKTPCLGAGGSSSWKTEASLIHKLRLRCSYLGGARGGPSTRHTSNLPPHDVPPLNTVDRTPPASSPPSPVPTRAAASMLVDCRDGDPADRKHVECGTQRYTATMSALVRHTCDLMASSGVRPELLVDFLYRRDVVGDDTVAAVMRCVARRAACELIAEAVTSNAEVAALCDGLRSTGCGDVAECLAAVDSLLQLQHTDSVSSHSQSLSTSLANDCLFK